MIVTQLSRTARAEKGLVLFFYSDLGMTHRTLTSHQPDKRGNCRGCSTQMHLVRWQPCRIWRLAMAACELLTRRTAETYVPVPRKATG